MSDSKVNRSTDRQQLTDRLRGSLAQIHSLKMLSNAHASLFIRRHVMSYYFFIIVYFIFVVIVHSLFPFVCHHFYAAIFDLIMT